MKKLFTLVLLVTSMLSFSQSTFSTKQIIFDDSVGPLKQEWVVSDSLIHVDYSNEKFIDYDLKVLEVSDNTSGDIETKIYMCTSEISSDQKIRLTFLSKKGKLVIITEETVDSFTGKITKKIYR